MRILEWLPSPLRQFRHAPLYSIAVAGSLTLGIAASCAAFGVVRKAFLDPLPYADAERLVALQTFAEGRRMAMSIFVTEDLRQSPLLTDISPLRFSSVTYEAPEAAERLSALEVTPTYFSLLGVAPAVGTVWTAGVTDGVIISWAFFERALSEPRRIG